MTYGNDGPKGHVEFEGVCDFDAQKWLGRVASTLGKILCCKSRRSSRIVAEFSREVPELVAPLRFTEKLQFFDRRIYTLNCNWKVYVDNYLDGGYHVPHAHKGLSSVIESPAIPSRISARVPAVQPLSSSAKSEKGVAASRQGRAFLSVAVSKLYDQRLRRCVDTNLVLAVGGGQVRRGL